MWLNNKKIYLLLLIIIILVQFIDNVNAEKKKVQLTPEQQAIKNKIKAERKKKSEEADKDIIHITEDDFKTKVMTDNTNLWIVFYGSKNCPFTQKFNPKWLEIQKKFNNKEIQGLEENVKIAKIECSGPFFKFCVSQKNEFWPELMFYYNGSKKGIYEGEDEIDDVIQYMVGQKEKIFAEVEKKQKDSKTYPPKKVVTLPTKNAPVKNSKKLENLKNTKPSKAPPVKVDEQGIIINDGKKGEDIKKNDEANKYNKNKDNKDDKDDDMKIYMGDDEANNQNDGENNEDESKYEDEDSQPNIVNGNDNDNNDYNGYYENEGKILPSKKTSSHVLPISVGGFVVGALVIMCYRTKKHQGGPGAFSHHGYSRPSQMNYKYSKNDKFIV